MWRLLLVAGAASLGAITPGAALLAVQQWTPVVLSLAGLAGAALAVAAAAYRKSTANARQLEAITRHIPKRSTDLPLGNPLNGVNVTPSETTPSSTAARIAPTHSGEVIE